MQIFVKLYSVLSLEPRQVGLVVSVSASHAVGRRFAPRPGHTKNHHTNGTNWLPAWQSKGRSLTSTARLSKRPGSVWNCLWVYALKHLLGSIARVGYCISVPDFYLVLHVLLKSTIMN